MASWVRPSVGAVLLLVGCPSPVVPVSGGATGTTGTTADSVSSPTASDGAATGFTSGVDSGSMDGNPADSSTGAPSFACPPVEGDPDQCDPYVQDCPEGFKCLLWDDRGSPFDFDGIVCAPIAPDPVDLYTACTTDVDACTDDCPERAACFPYFGEDPICINMCDEDAGCPGGQVCIGCGSCPIGLCMPVCDPLAPACPETLPHCTADFSYGVFSFSCDDSGIGTGQPGDPCNTPCAEGLLCVEPQVVEPGCGEIGCCTEICDLEDPSGMCSDPDHACIPLFDPFAMPPGLDHVGVCGLPEANPCATPGLCPPPGIDDTYPWCSDANDDMCDSYGPGWSDPTACEQGCYCYVDCEQDADCPVPPTGTSTPVCLERPMVPDTCVLPCDGGQVCPDGMTCADDPGGICVWVSPLPPEEC